MPTLSTSAELTEHGLEAITKELVQNEAQAFFDLLLQHQVIDYVIWRRYRFAGCTVEEVLRLTRSMNSPTSSSS